MRPVLIVAPADDLHAASLLAVLERDFSVPAIIWDRATLPVESKMDFRLDVHGDALHLTTCTGSHALEDFHSVWWRRPEQPRIDATVTDPRVRRFCEAESDAFLKGALRSLRVPIVNDPFHEAVALRKPYQLCVAGRVGLDIPKTLISNNAESIGDFWRSLDGKCIYKPLTSPSWTFAETRVLTEEDLCHLDRLRHAPMIVQEKIDKGVDVRVNIFGSAVYACEVESSFPQAELDWRIDVTARWYPHPLPKEVASKLIGLLRALKLHYGCIDLRQRPDGVYCFFEVNPSGQFLFAEIDTGQPLLHSLAELLVATGTTGELAGSPAHSWPDTSGAAVRSAAEV
jgi:MvdD pre-ATP grasp domain